MVRNDLLKRLSEYDFREVYEINAVLLASPDPMVSENDLRSIWELINLAIDRNESGGRESGLIEIYALEAELSIFLELRTLSASNSIIAA